MSGTTTELARVAGRNTRDTWLDDARFSDDSVNKLLKELDTTELDSELCSFLDSIELDEDLQFLRLSAGYCGRPSWKVIKYRCQLANESESFYRCRVGVGVGGGGSQAVIPSRVRDQLLFTVIQQERGHDVVQIHSNVVPRQAFLAGTNAASCPGHELCTAGFSPICVLRGAEPQLYRQSCTNCALAERLLRGGAHMDAELEMLWDLEEEEVDTVPGHSRLGSGSEGEVEKIFWRKGVFAKKKFLSAGTNLDREIEIATEVSHPNIVHCFGTSKSAEDGACLFMELLKESLKARLQEVIQVSQAFSFQDILDILWQVADAMKLLHDKNFIHGDLNPANILLSRLTMPHSKPGTFYLAKVADFGRAQRVPPEGFAEGRSGDLKSAGSSSAASKVFFNSIIGTRSYIAPEVLSHREYWKPGTHNLSPFLSRLNYDGAPPKRPRMIDVYSFGVVAYQMLAGVAELYPDKKPSEIKQGVVEGYLTPESVFKGTLDRDGRDSLLPLIRRCWHPNPEARPPFSDICEELKTHSIEHGKNGTHSIEHEKNGTHSIEHGKNGTHSIEHGNNGTHSIEHEKSANKSRKGDILAKFLKATKTMCCSNQDPTNSA